MRVAAVQLATTLDVEENRRRAVAAVDETSGAGASLVVLPEATMCTFGGPTFDLAAVAEPLDGPFVTALADAAGRTGATVVAGMFEVADEPSRVRNTVVVVGPQGLLGAYRKFHLFDALGWKESARIVPGDPTADGVVVVDVGDVRLGILTCYDLRFPEMARALVDQGATLLAIPAHWLNGPGKASVWDVLVAARAIENTAYVVAADKPEPECVGRSRVVDPAGEVVATLEGDAHGVLLAELSTERLDEVRASLPVLAHRRFDVRPTANGANTTAHRSPADGVLPGRRAPVPADGAMADAALDTAPTCPERDSNPHALSGKGF